MNIRQVVQVQILGAPRRYTYAWTFNPAAGEGCLVLGDKVAIPPNQVQEEGGAATVVALGSNYTGPMKDIVRVIRRAGDPPPPDDDDRWPGWGQGEYA